MGALLYIPWFKAEAWQIPLPFTDYELPIQPFGILVAIGVLLGAKISEVWGRRNGLSSSTVNDMIGHVVLGGFVGGYFLNSAFYHPDRIAEIADDPSKLFTVYLGLSSFGGFAGSIVGLLVWWARRRISPIAVGEAACFGFPFAWVFGRTGCFVTHDHPGRVTDFFLAVDGYEVGYPPFEPRHDLGLYEVFWALGACALFLALARKPRRRGFYMALLPISYAPVRFFLDYLRASPEDGGDVRYAELTPGQWGALMIFAIGVLIAIRIRAVEPTLPAWARHAPRPGDGEGAPADEEDVGGEPAEAADEEPGPPPAGGGDENAPAA